MEDKEGLCRLFSKYGIVKDANILEKKSKRGSKFGFVKYDCLIAAEMAIYKANGLRVRQNGNQKLFVKRANFGVEIRGNEIRRKKGVQETSKQGEIRNAKAFEDLNLGSRGFK